MADDSSAPVASEVTANLEKVRSIWDWFPTVEIAPIGVFRTTPEGKFSYANHELARIFEFDSPKDMMEQVTDIAKDLLVRPEQRVHFKTVLEKNSTVSDFICDFRTQRKRIRQASLTARLVKTVDDLLFYEGFLTDVTEQFETRSRLEELLRDVQGMAYRCECKPPWRMLWLSAGCGELTGYSQDDLLSAKPNYETLIHEEYRDVVAKAADSAIKTKTTLALSYPIRTANNETKWVLQKGKVVWTDNGKPMHLEGFITSDDPTTQIESREIQEIEKRKEFQKIHFRTALLWTFIIQFIVINVVVLIVVVLKATGSATNIGEMAIAAFFGQTVAQVAGLVYLIARYLFSVNDKSAAPELVTSQDATNHTPPIREGAQDIDRPSASEFEDEEIEKTKGKTRRQPQKG
jgi:PAS domain-containing protein